MCAFRNINLLRDFSSLGQFDIIFRRNVAIYFSPADRVELFGRIECSLAPDGCLIIGATESLTGVNAHFEPKRYLRSVFYQRGDGSGGATPAIGPGNA
jgi:chemotaxis protein methyltransferase CheR